MSKTKIVLITALVLIVIIFGAFIYKAGFTFSKIINIKNIAWERIFGKLPSAEYMPVKDENRINVLLLGLGGAGHEEGGLLTDSVMVVSFQKNTGKVALISIPRDLYITMPGEKKYEKINAAYALGETKYGNGLDYARKTVGYITGIYIDYVAAVDFEAFETVIDDLGGITVYLEEPFIEDKQWWCDETGENCRPFVIEAGEQVLDGETALLYVRSRFSSSDFDRAYRQQQVMLAIKDKLFSLGVLTNLTKINNLFNTVTENVRVNILPWEIPNLIKWIQKVDKDNIIKKVFDILPEGLLYQRIKDGIYILLPINDNFDKIREVCQRIFD